MPLGKVKFLIFFRSLEIWIFGSNLLDLGISVQYIEWVVENSLQKRFCPNIILNQSSEKKTF